MIQDAVAAAVPGTTIDVGPGTYAENVTVNAVTSSEEAQADHRGRRRCVDVRRRQRREQRLHRRRVEGDRDLAWDDDPQRSRAGNGHWRPHRGRWCLRRARRHRHDRRVRCERQPRRSGGGDRGRRRPAHHQPVDHLGQHVDRRRLRAGRRRGLLQQHEAPEAADRWQHHQPQRRVLRCRAGHLLGRPTPADVGRDDRRHDRSASTTPPFRRARCRSRRREAASSSWRRSSR